jgi:CBS domain-containing protein
MLGSQRVVGDVMTRSVVAVSRDAPFKEIVEAIDRWKITAVPVLEADGRVIGVVSEADLLAKQEFAGRAPSRREDLLKVSGGTAEEVMTAPAITVHPDATIAEAARVLALRRVKRLPVVDAEGVLTGIVSRGDLLKVYLRADAEIAEDIRYELATHLFPDEPRTIEVSVDAGVVTLAGTVRNTALIPIAARLAHAVEGVVNVEITLSGHPGTHLGAGPTSAAKPITPAGGQRL